MDDLRAEYKAQLSPQLIAAVVAHSLQVAQLMPNTHRRRRRDSSVLSSWVTSAV